MKNKWVSITEWSFLWWSWNFHIGSHDVVLIARNHEMEKVWAPELSQLIF